MLNVFYRIAMSRILIIEDETPMRTALKDVLEGEGYRVIAAADGESGLDRALKEKPDLIYCSITGFGQDGPYSHRAGYDLLAQGMGGIMDLTGMADGEPMRGGEIGKRVGLGFAGHRVQGNS